MLCCPGRQLDDEIGRSSVELLLRSLYSQNVLDLADVNGGNRSETKRTSDTPHEGTDATPESIPEDPSVPSLIDSMDLLGEGDVLERREAAISVLYERLREDGTATEEELRSTIDPDEVGYGSTGEFWEECVRGPNSLEELPGVAAPTDEERRWRYVGE